MHIMLIKYVLNEYARVCNEYVMLELVMNILYLSVSSMNELCLSN